MEKEAGWGTLLPVSGLGVRELGPRRGGPPYFLQALSRAAFVASLVNGARAQAGSMLRAFMASSGLGSRLGWCGGAWAAACPWGEFRTLGEGFVAVGSEVSVCHQGWQGAGAFASGNQSSQGSSCSLQVS